MVRKGNDGEGNHGNEADLVTAKRLNETGHDFPPKIGSAVLGTCS